MPDLAVSGEHHLDAQPQRPGELTTAVFVVLEPEAIGYTSRQAQTASVPLHLWLVIAIEAERSLLQAADVCGWLREELASVLDEVAESSNPSTRPHHPALDRLNAYARALRSPREAALAFTPAESLVLNPSLHVAAAWVIEAQRAKLSVEHWASCMASALLPDRMKWEAASAAHGQPLAEWALLHAARR